ncbi:hypothetical protein MKW94_000164 [Papaver nudicaule]|uniref:DUF7787 domain-containing protein n=1 Tax=Papaver nudicaule TaxID=74823 RepID=A0AA41RQQ7_PAPNU|nr:hypothetical protein [Papaver nudicaule]
MVGGGVPRWSLSLKDYVDFFLNPQQHYLNKNHLNQVTSMHGFQKLNIPRTELVEESKTFTMESPFRSTLKEKITSSSLLNPDEIIKDLATLRWNEWSTGSTRIEFAEAGKPSSSKKAADLYKNNEKKGLTDISNLPAGPNPNSRQNQAQKKNQGILEMGNFVSKKGKTSVGRKRIKNQVNKLNDPETVCKRSKLMLPAPQITDHELEEIDCFASDLLAGSEAQGSGATPALLASYSQTTREGMPHFRNPRKHLVGKRMG